MLATFLSHSVFAWWWTGHQQITLWAVGAAISALADSGRLARMAINETMLRANMATLWMMNVCQDADVGNVAGLCRIEVAGGQIAHFMCDSTQDKAAAYRLSVNRIVHWSSMACEEFGRAYPPPGPGGVLGALEAVARYTNPIGLGITAGQAVYNEAAGQRAQLYLARALHTLQDSYSPAHTLRDLGSGTLQDIYTWDDGNKNAHDDWPGHKAMDRRETNGVTVTMFERAKAASKTLIETALGGAQGGGAVSAVLGGLLMKNF